MKATNSCSSKQTTYLVNLKYATKQLPLTRFWALTYEAANWVVWRLNPEAKEHTFSSQARQRAASSAAQNTMAAALSQESQSVRIISSRPFHYSHISMQPNKL